MKHKSFVRHHSMAIPTIKIYRKCVGIRERRMRRAMRSPQPAPFHIVRNVLIVDTIIEWHGGF